MNTNEVSVSLSNLQPNGICIEKNFQSVGWGRPNLMCSVQNKMLEAILKKGWLGK
jgi:hypothetical protein